MADETETQRMLRAQKEWNAAHSATRKSGLAWWQWTLIVFGGVIVLGIIAPTPDEPRNTSSGAADNSEPSSLAAPLAVSAMELWSAYSENEAAAQQRFGDKPLAVSGVIDGIDLDFMNEPVVKLQSGNQFQSVQADFDKDDMERTAALRKGASITVLCGSVTEVAGTPMLDDCRLP